MGSFYRKWYWKNSFNKCMCLCLMIPWLRVCLNRVFNKSQWSTYTRELTFYLSMEIASDLQITWETFATKQELWISKVLLMKDNSLAGILSGFSRYCELFFWSSTFSSQSLICSWCNLICCNLTIKYTVIVHHFWTNYCTCPLQGKILSLTWFNTNKGNK